MSCYDLCSTSACGVARPQPLSDSCNEPCVRQCPDSTTLIQPPAVVVTFPGPILTNFPQDSVVGSHGAPVLPASSLSHRGYGSLGYGGLYGYGGYGSLGYGGLYGYGGYGSLGYRGLYGYGGYGYGGLGGYGGYGSLGYGGLYGYGRGYGSSNCNPYSFWGNRYGLGSCGPC